MRVDHLLALSLISLSYVDDFADAQARSIRLADSPVAALRAMGLLFHGWMVSYSGPDRAARLVASAEVELEEARRSEPGRNTEIAATFFLVYRGGHRLVAFDYQGALDDARESMAIAKRIDFSIGPPVLAAMCLMLLDRPADASELLDQDDRPLYDAMQPSWSTYLRMLVGLALGDLEAADEVRAVAARGTARRYAHEANDCVVLLTGLALAEGDREAATSLVLDAGTGSGPACSIADYFARRLDVLEQRQQRIVEAIRSRDPSNNTGRAAIALQNELARRGWATEP